MRINAKAQGGRVAKGLVIASMQANSHPVHEMASTVTNRQRKTRMQAARNKLLTGFGYGYKRIIHGEAGGAEGGVGLKLSQAPRIEKRERT